MDAFDNVKSCILSNVQNPSVSLVFPTDISAKKWADWTVRNSSVSSLAMERFLPWDTFKGSFVRGQKEGFSAVPSMLRRVFVSRLLEKNSKAPFFKHLIPREHCSTSANFCDFISGFLPQLALWKRLYDIGLSGLKIPDSEEDAALRQFYAEYAGQGFKDEEDEDLLVLFTEYSSFLDENKLFEPAWITPVFEAPADRSFYIVYPDLLEDWPQYRSVLSGHGTVSFVQVPADDGEYESLVFENSRTELQGLALLLQELHSQGIDWFDMAVTVPKIEGYGAYLERELSLFGIPYSLRLGKALSDYGAGKLFAQLQACVLEDFSFSSVKELLQNEEIPWRNPSTVEDFLLFGRLNNCLCSFENQRNPLMEEIWEASLKRPRETSAAAVNKNIGVQSLLRDLKSHCTKMVKALSFQELRTEYEKFRDVLIDQGGFADRELSYNVISRCITTLNELVELESQYPSYRLASPYSFFVTCLSSVQYLARGDDDTIQVYPYRAAAAAPYKVHAVIDASQDSLAVGDSFKRLGFLNENKRSLFLRLTESDKSLGFYDEDPSYSFIRLYEHSALCKSYFSAAKHGFGGVYGFANGRLNSREVDASPVTPYSQERLALLHKETFPQSLLKSQAEGFLCWSEHGEVENEPSSKELLKRLIKKTLMYVEPSSRNAGQLDERLLCRYKISQSTLRKFFKCPRLWLYENVLKLQILENEAELINQFIVGNVNHKILELYFTRLKAQDLPLRASESDSTSIPDAYKEILCHAMNLAVEAETDFDGYADTAEAASAFVDDWGKRSVSEMTRTIIQERFSVREGRETPQLRLLEQAVAGLSRAFSGYKVFALELELNALARMPGASDTEPGYYLNGKIDCVLCAPGGQSYAVIDYKTSSAPTNLVLKPEEAGKPKQYIDFQMPMYLYLLKNSLELPFPLAVTTAAFYSVKKQQFTFYLGDNPSAEYDEKEQIKAAKKILEREGNAELCQTELLKCAAELYSAVNECSLAVSRKNQSESLCALKGEHAACGDYQAVCRRYFSVAGERLGD